jgi:hypothetical protein
MIFGYFGRTCQRFGRNFGRKNFQLVCVIVKPVAGLYVSGRVKCAPGHQLGFKAGWDRIGTLSRRG